MFNLFKKNKNNENKIEFYEQMQEKTFDKNNVIVGAAGTGKTKFFIEPRISESIYRGEDILYIDRDINFIDAFFYKLRSNNYKITIVNKVSNSNLRDQYERKITDYSELLNSAYTKRSDKHRKDYLVKLIRLYKDFLDYENLIFIEEGNKKIDIDPNNKNFVFIVSPYSNFIKSDEENEIDCLKNIILNTVKQFNPQTKSLISSDISPFGFIDFNFFVDLDCPNKLLYVSSQNFPDNIEHHMKNETFAISFLGGNTYRKEYMETIKNLVEKSNKIKALNGNEYKYFDEIEKDIVNLAKFHYVLFIDKEAYILKCPINL